MKTKSEDLSVTAIVPRFIPGSSEFPILARFACRHTSLVCGWQEAFAYLSLHMPEAALRVLDSRRGACPETAELAALRLLAMELAGADPATLCGEAFESLERLGWNWNLFASTLFHAIDGGQWQTALDLCERWRRRLGSPVFHGFQHNLACALAHSHREPEALEIVSQVGLLSPFPADLLRDDDLEPLWQYYARVQPSPQEADCLLSEGIARIVAEARAGRIRRSLTGSTVREALPVALRPWMVRVASGHYELGAAAPAEIRRARDVWLMRHLQSKLRLADQAIDLARAVRQGQEAGAVAKADVERFRPVYDRESGDAG